MSLEETCDRITSLINRRKWPAAFELARTAEKQWKGSSKTLLLLHLCAALNNDYALERELRHRILHHSSLGQFPKGDALRDFAIMMIRNGKLADADIASSVALTLTEIQDLHRGDQNRLLCLMGVRGRYHRERGNSLLALEYCLQAELGWQKIGARANNQWRLNNWLHLQSLCAESTLLIGHRIVGGLPNAVTTGKHILASLLTTFIPGGRKLAKRILR